MPPMPPHHWPAPRPTPQALRAHQDAEGVAVWDFIIDQALEVDGLQLEVDGDVDQPGWGEAWVRVRGLFPSLLPRSASTPAPR